MYMRMQARKFLLKFCRNTHSLTLTNPYIYMHLHTGIQARKLLIALWMYMHHTHTHIYISFTHRPTNSQASHRDVDAPRRTNKRRHAPTTTRHIRAANYQHRHELRLKTQTPRGAMPPFTIEKQLTASKIQGTDVHVYG
jgi:hypothetical protein